MTIAVEDAALGRLLAAALEACEAFTGLMLLEQTCEEVLAPGPTWQALATRPVQAIVAVERIGADGARAALPADACALELDAHGTGRVRVSAAEPMRVAVRFTAGLGTQWDALPEALRHGVVRLAAHQHREREASGAAPLPPASVAALWRPWRRMRLA